MIATLAGVEFHRMCWMLSFFLLLFSLFFFFSGIRGKCHIWFTASYALNCGSHIFFGWLLVFASKYIELIACKRHHRHATTMPLRAMPVPNKWEYERPEEEEKRKTDEIVCRHNFQRIKRRALRQRDYPLFIAPPIPYPPPKIANRFSSELTFFNMSITKLNDPSENAIAHIMCIWMQCT